MIHLNVTLNPTLIDCLKENGWKGVGEAWEDFCTRHFFDLRTLANFFESDRELSSDELSLLDDTALYMDSNLQQSIDHITCLWRIVTGTDCSDNAPYPVGVNDEIPRKAL